MFLKIYFFITGSLKIRVRGYMAFRFLNILAGENIYVWSIFPCDEGISFKMGRRDLERAEKTAKRAGCRMEILSEKGLPVYLNLLKKRYFFAAGALFFSLFLLFSTRRIWLIEVRGNYRASTGEILEFCAENSLTYGVKKSDLDTNLIEREIKNRFKDISFVSVSVSGTRALITVSETLPAAEEKSETAPGDITAECSAVITDLTVSAGTPVVKEGTAVSAGDVLISGEVFLKAEQEVLGSVNVAAEGKVYGKTVEGCGFTLPLKEKYKRYIEKEYNSYEIEIFNKKFLINIIKRDTNSEKCDKIESKKQLRLWNDIYLPVIINKTTYLPYSLYERDLTAEAARKKADEIITAKIINEYPADAQVLDKSLSLNKTEAGYRVSAEIVVIKQIGVFRER